MQRALDDQKINSPQEYAAKKLAADRQQDKCPSIWCASMIVCSRVTLGKPFKQIPKHFIKWYWDGKRWTKKQKQTKEDTP